MKILARDDVLQRALQRLTNSSTEEDSSLPLTAAPQHPFLALSTLPAVSIESATSHPLREVFKIRTSTRRRPKEAPKEVLNPDLQTKQKGQEFYGIK